MSRGAAGALTVVLMVISAIVCVCHLPQARPPSAVWPASGADIIGSPARTNDPDAGCLAQDAEPEVLVRAMHLRTSQATSVVRAAFSCTASSRRRGASFSRITREDY